MSGLAGWLNAAWMWRCGAEAAAFRRACRDVAGAQRGLLAGLLAANQGTSFGAAHGFDRLRGPRDYQAAVPCAGHEAFAPYVERIAAGEPNVLTAEPVRLLEPTSGSSGGEKLIPYTATLRSQFQRGVAAWIADLFAHRPGARRGRAYWSISPALGPPRRSAGGVPIGFDDDAAYLGWAERHALRLVLAVPPAVAHLPDVATARYATLLFLLAADDLSLISVWSPSFLTALLAPLRGWLDRLLFDLGRGTFSPPCGGDGRPLAHWLRALPARAARLRALAREPDDAAFFRLVWPRLALISCWADAAAALFLPEVRRLFPGVEVQPKGLLATEGFVSLPLVGREGGALAVRSHFFELEEDGGRFVLAHEAERGGVYRVVLTTGGGLYRYALRDEVEVVGHVRRCPLVRFLGRADRVSDLVGEKLSEGHVQAVLARLFGDAPPRFVLLVPVLGPPPRYRLYVQGGCQDGALAGRLQAGLEESPYYRHAVAAGQLAEAEVRWLDEAGEPGWAVYERQCLARGQRAGDIKPAALGLWTGWDGWFGPAGRGANG